LTHPFQIDDLIKCARRELSMRKHVYPRRVLDGRMTKTQSDKEIAMMEAIIFELEKLAPRLL
jgi:hypothetical protein